MALHDASPEIMKILLRNGANVAATCDNGFTALHISALFGRTRNIDVLVRIGGSSLEKEDGQGRTAFLVAVFFGEFRAVATLESLGSDVNYRYRDGATALHCAVRMKHRHVLRVLLRGRSDPMLLFDGQTAAQLALSLGYDDIADEITGHGHQEALQSAVIRGDTGAISTILNSEPRVIDRNGSALCVAIMTKSETCVKALLSHHDSMFSGTCSYVNNANIERVGWLSHVLGGASPSPRIARLLVEAGADTTSPILCKWEGRRAFMGYPVQSLRTAIRADSEEEDVDDEHLFRLERILRLFMQAPAVHATSWLWPNSTGGRVGVVITRVKSKKVKKPSAIVRMLPLLRRRGAKRRDLLLAVERWGTVFCRPSRFASPGMHSFRSSLTTRTTLSLARKP